MATAPRPGAIRQQTESDKAFVITVDNVPVRLVVADLGPKDAVRIRRLKLGFSLAGLMSMLTDEAQMDVDIPCALWWLARVKAGENRLTWDEAVAQFPGYEDFGDRVSIEVEDEDVNGGWDEDGTPEA